MFVSVAIFFPKINFKTQLVPTINKAKFFSTNNSSFLILTLYFYHGKHYNKNRLIRKRNNDYSKRYEMKKEELPQTMEALESRAMLYHILMDLEEFLVYKARFIRGLDEQQKRKYWKA